MTHSHHHHHDEPHRVAALAPGAPRRRNVHRLDRRRFLTDLGRGTFAVAILGAAACSSADSGSSTTTSATVAAGGSDTDTGGDAGETTSSTSGEEAGTGGAALTWSQVSFGFVSAYVLGRGSEAVVVDTGGEGNAPQIGETLSTMGLGWEAVGHVVLTHHHPDHVGSLGGVLGETPTATVYAGEADIPNIRSANPLTAVGDGDEILGLQVLNTPGHTPGSISLLDPGIGLLVAGDALTANDDGTTVQAPSDQFSDDIATAAQSVRDMAALDVETVLVGHGQPVEAGGGTSLQELADSL